MFYISSLFLLAVAAPHPQNPENFPPLDPAVRDAQHLQNGAQAQAASTAKWTDFTAAAKHKAETESFLAGWKEMSGIDLRQRFPEKYGNPGAIAAETNAAETATKAASGFAQKAKSLISKLRFW